MFGGLFDAQGSESENAGTENERKSRKNEGKMVVAEAVCSNVVTHLFMTDRLRQIYKQAVLIFYKVVGV